jgi:hypothetical protein
VQKCVIFFVFILLLVVKLSSYNIFMTFLDNIALFFKLG